MHYSSTPSRIHLSTVVMLFGIGISGLVSVLSIAQSDPQGCNVSPDNSGCILNRPVDIQRRQEKEYSQSQSLLFLEGDGIKSDVIFD